tara:strand:- start:323 stop:571 length:249 start_codon:yes stop_codon:yes gene_type:complete
MYYIHRVMIYTQKRVDKIYNCKVLSNKEKVDQLLEMDTVQYVNCGTDSTVTERELVKENSLLIYKMIQKLDSRLGNILLNNG